ncbi:cytochrome c oxidase subunit IVB [Heyndrickxia vini]|uniref:Cytochrome c oxidase subunit IVB n=1 Tax=Heyndrickxia vini TaxID=1476025 RepID=A0ABX7DYP8_9BACI|nr:cytochrome c oxidase subunit IVB [Heyndrickxia vini]QQZ08069.1 cytochrome c oxidase subunit IVB [Heyndrickxia vini]
MTNEQINTGNPRVDYDYRRRKSAEEMKYQVVSFVLMILLTLIAFGAVAADLSKWFTIPVILLMAVVQVIFQLYYFMHMSHKGHEAPQLFLFSGALVGFLTLLTFFTIVWW